MAKTLSVQNLSQLETLLETYLVKKAPALPENIKSALVKYGPYLIILGIILTLPAVLALFGLGAILMPVSFVAGAGFGFGYTLSLIALGVSLVLEALALPGLFKRSLVGWRYLFYASLMSLVVSLLQFNLIGLILGVVLGLYLLFQIKSYYK